MTIADLTEEHAVKDFVNVNPPHAIKVFNEAGIDYCCGGNRSLKAACADLGLSAAEVIRRLSQASPAAQEDSGEDWTACGPSELVDHIVETHHKYLEARLPELSAMLDKVIGAHGGNHPELYNLKKAYLALRADLEPHMQKEEKILFPMIKRQEETLGSEAAHCGSIANPIRVMRGEHDRAGRLLERIRALTGAYSPPADACQTYTQLFAGLKELEADVHLHIHKENNILFPAALAGGG